MFASVIESVYNYRKLMRGSVVAHNRLITYWTGAAPATATKIGQYEPERRYSPSTKLRPSGCSSGSRVRDSDSRGSWCKSSHPDHQSNDTIIHPFVVNTEGAAVMDGNWSRKPGKRLHARGSIPPPSAITWADIAQLVEQLPCKEKVAGSNPCCQRHPSRD